MQAAGGRGSVESLPPACREQRGTFSRRRWFVKLLTGVVVMFGLVIYAYFITSAKISRGAYPLPMENDTAGRTSNVRIPTDHAATYSAGADCADTVTIDRQKALVIGHRRRDRGFLTVGITTVKRTNASYLERSVQSLINQANLTEREATRIVVFACDFEEADRQEARDIVSSFPEHVQSGLLQLVEAPRSFYPPLSGLKRTFNNTAERVLWRSKENLDNAFLLAYAVDTSDFYLQLDDDFVVRKSRVGYVSTIRDFIAEHRGDHWALIDVSRMGTGKLFRNKDLLHVAGFLRQFYQEQPVDLLLNHLVRLYRQERRFVINPPLFRHFGKVSSLRLKNQDGFHRAKWRKPKRHQTQKPAK